MTGAERRARLPFWGWALVLAVVARLYSGILVALSARTQVPNPWTGDPVTYTGMTLMWDGTWYRRIAETGYPAVLPHDAAGALQQNEWAFYPLFPMLCRGVMAVTGLGFGVVGGTVALLLGLAATLTVAGYLRRFLPDAVALGATAVWAFSFASPVLQLAYTESLAVLLLAAFLLLVDTRHWWSAAAVALLIGLARPIGVPLAVVAVVAVGYRVWRARTWDRGRAERGATRYVAPVRGAEAVSMAASVAACGVAGILWPAIAWWGTGVRTAYTDTMATWRSSPHIVPFHPWLDNARYFFGENGPWLLAGVVIGYAVVILGPWAWRLPPAAYAWCVAYPIYLGAVLDPVSSTFRYLLPLFPVLGVVLGIRRRAHPVQLVAALLLTVAGAVLQVWWIWSFLVYTPPVSWPP